MRNPNLTAEIDWYVVQQLWVVIVTLTPHYTNLP